MSRRFASIGCVGLALLIAACATPTPNSNSNSRSAQLSELRNTVEARKPGASEWKSAAEGQRLSAGGGVRTGEAARARVDISDGTIVRLAPDTEFELTTLSTAVADPVSQFTLAAGKVWVSVSKALGNGSFEVQTPVGVAAVRGSLMSAEYFPANGQMIVTCLEGAGRLTGTSGKFTDLTVGQQTGIPGFGRDPGAAIPINVVQLGQWAQMFPEALPIVSTLTPGPPPTATPPFTPTP